MTYTGWLSYFTKPDYNIDTLKRVMDNRILSLAPSDSKYASWVASTVDAMFFRTKEKNNLSPTNMEEVLRALQERMYFEPYKKVTEEIALSSTIEKYAFIKENNLMCITSWKVVDQFCDVNINRFIKQLPDANLDQGRADLVTIANNITKADQVDAFCSNLMTNVLRKPYPTEELDKIMGSTCKWYNRRYEVLKRFLWVQNEIESIVSENIVAWDMDVNLFKLVSLQQKIYAQHKDKLLDTNTIITYLRFLNALLNDTTNKIPQFYIEEAYYYNNIYVKNMLQKLTIESVNPTVNDDVSKILDIISNLNKGNSSVGIVWLDNLIINRQLQKNIVNNTWSFYYSLPNFEQLFSDVMMAYPELRITKLETDETTRTARVIGLAKFKDTTSWKPVSINIVADFAYQDGWFKLISARTPQDSSIDQLIQWYIAKNQWSTAFGTVLYIIESNTDLFNTDLSLCNLVGWLGAPLMKLISCSKNEITVTFAKETIILTVENDVITKGISTNIARQKLLDTLIKWKNINQDRLWGVLLNIGEAVSQEVNKKEDLTENDSLDPIRINIIAKFNKFLWVEPDKIEKIGNNREVVFLLKENTFKTTVNIEANYKLSPLSVRVNNDYVTINSFSLTLIPFSQTRITQFVDDPLDFIKQIDPKKYDEIMKFQWDKTETPQ